jgi:hypothetical protein
MSAPWFKQPKYMPDWLYTYFGEVVKPLITMKEDRRLAAPPSYTARDTVRSSPRVQAFGSIPPSLPFFFHGAVLNRLPFTDHAYSYGFRISLLINYIVHHARRSSSKKMVFCALVGLLIWTIAITSLPGGTTVARDASHTSQAGDMIF